MSLRKRNQNTVKVDKDPMQQEDPYPKSPTGSHDQQQGRRQYTGDNPRQSTRQNWIARARNLDAFEIIVAIVVIVNIIITVLLSCDAVNRRYDVSANTPDERIGNLERKVSAIDNRIVEFKSDIDKIKTKLETIETEKPWQQHVDKLEEEIENLDTKFKGDMRAIEDQMPSKEKINEVLKVQEDLESLQQKVDTIDQEWKGLNQSVGETLGKTKAGISSFETKLKQVEDKQKEWMISPDITAQQHVENTSQLRQEMDELRQNCQQIQKRLETEVSDRNSTLKSVVSKLESSLTTIQKELKSNIDNVTESLNTEIEERKQNIFEMNRDMTVLKTRVDNVTKSLETEIDERKQNISEINRNMTVLKTRVDNVTESLNTEIEERKQNISVMNRNLTVLKTRVDNVTKSLNTEIDERKQNISVMNRNMTDLKTRVDNVAESLNTEIEERKQNITTLDKKITDTTYTVENNLQNHIQESSQKISQLQTQVKEIDNINNKLDKINTSVGDHSETLSNVNSQLKFQEEVHSETRKGHESSFLRNDYAILIVFVVGVLILILFVMVCKRQNVHFDQEPSFVEAATGPVSRNFVSSRSVLDQIQRQPLSNEVCIISFYTSTQPLHRRLASSAISDVSIKTAVIEKHENIPTLPHVKTFLVFVDFNERNIILEDPNREIGDLKLTTVQGALKLGGNVYVIYVRDNGSKALPEGQLINIKLTSINNHSLLRTLNQENKVLTTFDEFTPYQKQYLKRNIWH